MTAICKLDFRQEILCIVSAIQGGWFGSAQIIALMLLIDILLEKDTIQAVKPLTLIIPHYITTFTKVGKHVLTCPINRIKQWLSLV